MSFEQNYGTYSNPYLEIEEEEIYTEEEIAEDAIEYYLAEEAAELQEILEADKRRFD